MNPKTPFKWRHYQPEIILLCVRWYLRYPLSYRNLEEMMAERGLTVDHSTIYRWVMHYAPQLEKRCRLHLQQTNDSWRVDETYVRVKGKWKGSVAKNGMGFKSFNTARQTLREIEAMSMIRQGQVNRINQGDNISQVKFIEELFGAIASGNANDIDCLSLKSIYDTTSISSKVGIRA